MALAARGCQICGPLQRSRADIWADYRYSQKRCRKMALAHYPASRLRDWDCACLPEVPLSQLQGFLQCIQPLREAPATVNSEDAHTRRQGGLQNSTSWQTAHGRQPALVPFPEGTHRNSGLDLGALLQSWGGRPAPPGLRQPRARRTPAGRPQGPCCPGSVQGAHFDRDTLPPRNTGQPSTREAWEAPVGKQPSHHRYCSLSVYACSPLHEHNP